MQKKKSILLNIYIALCLFFYLNLCYFVVAFPYEKIFAGGVEDLFFFCNYSEKTLLWIILNLLILIDVLDGFFFWKSLNKWLSKVLFFGLKVFGPSIIF